MLSLGPAGPLIGLVLLCSFMSFYTQTFLTGRNILNILDQVTVLGIMSLGMTLVILIGGIDLSVGSILALAIMVMSTLARDHAVPMAAAIGAALLAGAIAGAVNGAIIVRAALPPFIATLSMMSVARGLAYMLTNGRQISGFPDWFTDLSIVRHFGFLSAAVGLLLLLIAITAFVLSYTTAGRALYAIGGSPIVARFAGIPVAPATFAVYTVSGVCAALGGVILSSRLDSAGPGAGIGYEVDVIAAVVIGGGSLSGGVGGIGGTVIGTLIIGVLRISLNLAGISPFVQQVAIGVVIALAVMLDRVRRRD